MAQLGSAPAFGSRRSPVRIRAPRLCKPLQSQGLRFLAQGGTMANSLKSRSVDHPYRIIFIVCAVITVGAGVLRRPDVDEDLKEHLPEQATGRGFTTSVTCQACHPAQYDAWHRSYHRTMTQVATPSTVLATFDDVVLVNHGFRYQFVRRDDEIWVEMPDPLWFERPLWLNELL